MSNFTIFTYMFKPVAKPEHDLFENNVVDIKESLAHKQDLFEAMFPQKNAHAQSDTDEAKRETIGDYVDSITGWGDLMAAKQTMRALTAYSLKNDRLYDDILMKLNTWIIANDRESETNNNFYGSVGAVGSQIGNQNIDHQMVAEPQPEKLIYGRQN